jgi:cell volume regulation protein A
MTFGGFTFASEVPLGSIAAFYGFSIPEAENETSLADFVCARLPPSPTLGDRITFEGIELVVRGMNGDRITKIGLELEPRARGLVSESSPATDRGI